MQTESFGDRTWRDKKPATLSSAQMLCTNTLLHLTAEGNKFLIKMKVMLVFARQ